MPRMTSSLYSEALSLFENRYARVQESDMKDPTAVALATASPDGAPSVRTVLLKGFDADGFVFYTNHESRKGHQLSANPKAALCFYWPSFEEQVLIEGTVAPVDGREADAYWKTRPRVSQLGAWASQQSRPLNDRKMLEDRLAALDEEYRGKDVPRPPYWSGFRLSPQRIEFWKAQPFRLHERVLYENTPDGWIRGLLFP